MLLKRLVVTLVYIGLALFAVLIVDLDGRAVAEGADTSEQSDDQGSRSFSIGDRFRDCDECPEMVVVPAGSYQRGSPSHELGRQEEEGPVYQVTVAVPFAMGVHEVTVAEFGRFAEESGHSMPSSCWTREDGEYDNRAGRNWRNPGFEQSGRHPVTCVSWNVVQDYVEWLSQQAGEEYRLPSESEWEYAARAGTVTARPWGENESDQCRHANGADESMKGRHSEWARPVASCRDGYADTAPTGSFAANRWGLHDMMGNVWEWTDDCWNSDYAGAPLDGSAWEHGDCDDRVVRGGGWETEPAMLRVASRHSKGQAYGFFSANSVGFRVARTLAGSGLDSSPRLQPDRFHDCPKCPEMAVVPRGSYRMGSPRNERRRAENEGPVRGVTIGEPFALGVYEVTVAEFGRFAAATGHSAGSSCVTLDLDSGSYEENADEGWRNPGFEQSSRHPVTCVSWEDAQAYVAWLSRETGEEYRLPSESEWEYAARAGTVTARPWEQASGQCLHANGADASLEERQSNWTTAPCRDGHVHTAPVGSFEANGWGLHDMLGNAWEWTEDCYNDGYAGAPSDGNPWEYGECSERVLRGGSWIHDPPGLRAAYRTGAPLGFRIDNFGFRVAKTLAASD